MYIQVIPRQYSVVIKEEPNSLDYTASGNVFVYGDIGMMYTINGKGFYEALAKENNFKDLMNSLGIRTLEGYATPNHVILIKHALRKVANLQIRHRGNMSGHELEWIVVTLKD